MENRERRIRIKEHAKRSLNRNFMFYLLLFLPVFILGILGGFMEFRAQFNATSPVPVYNGTYGGAQLFVWIAALLMIGVNFAQIDLERGVAEYKEPVSKSFTILNRGDYFLNGIGLSVLRWIMIFLWSLLLVVPGIIKTYSYSQALFIYRDYLDQGKKITYTEAITLSRQMMDGHKWELFIVQLSFIGWFITCIFPPMYLYVMPYYQQSMANFYVNLVAEGDEATDEETPEVTVFYPNHSDDESDDSNQ